MIAILNTKSYFYSNCFDLSPLNPVFLVFVVPNVLGAVRHGCTGSNAHSLCMANKTQQRRTEPISSPSHSSDAPELEGRQTFTMEMAAAPEIAGRIERMHVSIHLLW